MSDIPLAKGSARERIVRNWLPRYTGMPLEGFGRLILLTNFFTYVERFSRRFASPITGVGGPMQACTSPEGITIVNFGIGSPNAATIMDLLSAVHPDAALFLGKCGGLKHSVDLGHFVLPIAAIRGEGTGLDYYPIEVPALPSFRLHALLAEQIVKQDQDYRTGVVYTTNRRVWEHDEEFKDHLVRMRAIGIDMETATLFLVGHFNEIPRGALLLVSDVPVIPEGIKTEEMDREVTAKFSDMHLEIGIQTMQALLRSGEKIKHLRY
jgi:AMP nucleosidase